MKLALVINKIWSTIKADSLEGFKFLCVQPLDNFDSPPLVVADALDAGIGETVIITVGSSARIGEGDSNLPIDGTVIAIVDEETK